MPIHAKHVFVFCLLLFYLAGCSVLPGRHNNDGLEMEELVSEDLVKALSTLVGYRAADGEVQMTEPHSAFGKLLLRSLKESGYGVQVVSYRQGQRYVSFMIESLQNEQGISEGYTLNVGSVSLRREYMQDERGVFPVTLLEVAGANGTGVVDNSLRTEPFEDNRLGTLTAIDADKTMPVSLSLFAEAPHSNDLRDEKTGLKPRSPVADGSLPEYSKLLEHTSLPKDPSEVPRLNMYKTRKSNFAAYTSDYKEVLKTVLVFPNDSLRMTPDVRTKLEEFEREFESATDVFSVIGCSHGNTALDNGNELLAIGRSRRVQHELIELGVPERQILDEGCWAPVHFDEMMPRRGVVLALKRKPA